MDEKYFAQKIEQKWQKRWTENGTFAAETDEAREKFYCLEMLPYPSGRLHMGHVRNYSIGDALAWYKRLQGFNVLHPIGWDSFGQPAEQAAIKKGVNPRDWTEDNINQMREQLQRLGISYDWRREIAAHRPARPRSSRRIRGVRTNARRRREARPDAQLTAFRRRKPATTTTTANS